MKSSSLCTQLYIIRQGRKKGINMHSPPYTGVGGKKSPTVTELSSFLGRGGRRLSTSTIPGLTVGAGGRKPAAH